MSAAGFYHCSVKGVGRAAGRSVVAAAAYRSGERLIDEITGLIADYQLRHGVVDKFIVARDEAPAWSYDRGQLWNAAEHKEDRANGRLATEIELALPCELTDAQRRELVMGFVRGIVAQHGVAADVAIHAPGQGGDHRNHHAHVLLTHRELGADGYGEIAHTRIQTRKRKGKDGQHRQEQEKVSGIAATPADIKVIRKAWERDVNRAYEQSGLDIKVDHRSHEDRGIEDDPTKHLGPTATAMEREGKESERGAANREITQRNAERRAQADLEAEERRLKQQIAEATAKEAVAASQKAPANQNIHEPLTLEAIQRDPWNAVYLAVPPDADRTLLAAVSQCAAQCARSAFALMRVSAVIEPELTGYYHDRQVEADDRREEARKTLAALPQEQVAKVSPFLQPKETQAQAMDSLRGMLQERRLVAVPEPLRDALTEQGAAIITAESLAANPWDVPFGLIPPGASDDLLEQISATGFQLSDDAWRRRDEESATPEEFKLWNEIGQFAREVAKDANFELTKRYEPELVQEAERQIAEERAAQAAGQARFRAEPGRYDDLRAAELEALRELSERRRTKWEFARAAEETTEPRAEPVFDRRGADEAPPELRQQPDIHAQVETPAYAKEATADRRAAAVEPSDTLASAGAPAPDTGLRPADQIITRIFSGIADAVETVLGGILDFFGGGPTKLTSQQMRERAAAETNLETVQARAYAADERQNEAEADERQFQTNKQQQEDDLSFAAFYGVAPPPRETRNAARSRDPDDDDDPTRRRGRSL
jgi:MobA/MobL family